MNSAASTTPAVLHVVPPNGGGVDRYVRGISNLRQQDWILHVSERQWVVEHPANNVLIPIASTDGAISVLGEHRLVHAHSALPETRAAVSQLSGGLRRAYVLTLHDIAFADNATGTPPEEQAARTDFVRRADHLIAPSHYMADTVRQMLKGELPALTVVPNGIDHLAAIATHTEVPPGQPVGFDVAVIGALGLHKGLRLLEEVVACLPPRIRVLVIGYVDGQTEPGWRIQDRLWIHGAFEPSELKAIVAHHGVRMAFFPNKMPESFCYALSDAWLAGLPALVPAHGALGERMATWGAGWCYPPGESAALIAQRIADALPLAGTLTDRIETTARQQPSDAQMVNQLEKIYTAHAPAGDPANPLPAIARVAQTHLNGAFFRQELVKLTRERAELLAQQSHLRGELAALSQAQAERATWIDKQQSDLQTLKNELERVESARVAENQQLAAVVDDLRRSVHQLNHDKEALVQQLSHLQHQHRESEALLSALLLPLRLLPRNFRERLIRSAKWRLARRKQND